MNDDHLSQAVWEQSLVLYQNGQYAEVLRGVDTIVPDAVSASLLDVAAYSAYALERYDLAEKYWHCVIDIQPDNVDAYNNLGIVYKSQGEFDKAKEAYVQAMNLDPDDAKLHNNIANLFREINCFEQAEAEYRRAIQLQPNYGEAHRNLGMLFKELHRFEEAEASYKEALRLNPGCVRTQANLGFLLLELGRYEEGWVLYESRCDLKVNPLFPFPAVSFPQWKGESLAGKSIVIFPEQGFGDEIQFVRYTALLKKRGASRITLVCKEGLKRLFLTLRNVDSVIVPAEGIETHDYWTFLVSLPFHLKTTVESIPSQIPYVGTRPEWIQKWQSYLPKNGFRVGLVWKGSGEHSNDANRSLPSLASLAPLWGVPGVSFISLQKGAGEEEARIASSGVPIIYFGSEVEDFADTAAIVAQLDLVISVDTAVAHLCGALGKRCWVLLPSIGTDWRWLRERTDSPWYPKRMRLFRQTDPNDWNKTIDEVAAALLKFTAEERVVG